MSEKKTSLFEESLKPLKNAAAILKLSSDVVEVLSSHERILTVTIPVKMDNGKIKVFTGYRAQHNTARGPAKGGIRYHPSVCLDEVKSLSYWMSIKNAVVGIPYGGGKGGITCNPKELSIGELERLTRGYAARIARFIGVDKDVPAPDVNTTAQIMGWIADEYYKIMGEYLPGVITSKSLSIGGSKGRDTATGRGAYFATLEAVKALNISLKGARVSIQGFGNAAQPMAQYLHELGSKIVAVSDSTAGVYNANGINPIALIEHKNKTKSVKGFPGTKAITTEDPITLDCDILIPAALETQITLKNADKVKAKLVVEEANGPTTPEADKILHDRGVFVIPDVLANAGGVTVSYFEWVQNRMGYYWSNEEVDEKLKRVMNEAFHDVYQTYLQCKVDMRTAAYVTAVRKIVDAMSALGRI
ncbi:Glu/Leu/Phe/Val dehydrogenase [Candidatus Bathyarchaeota archaeon]|nr:Glu/Leu/Phe/Val dehydrogenase [Candidatus Bathyarchaeota archaeon]